MTDNNLIPARIVRQMLGNVSDMTIWRWLHDDNYKDLNFPKPITIATRRYWKRGSIESFINQQQGGES